MISLSFISGVSGLLSFLTGIIISGIPISISFSNSGSAWDNSKKIIESTYNINLVNYENSGKDDDKELDYLRKLPTKNAVVGDNIGDAFKDITGPAINILIKFSSIFSLVIVNSFDISN